MNRQVERISPVPCCEVIAIAEGGYHYVRPRSSAVYALLEPLYILPVIDIIIRPRYAINYLPGTACRRGKGQFGALATRAGRGNFGPGSACGIVRAEHPAGVKTGVQNAVATKFEIGYFVVIVVVGWRTPHADGLIGSQRVTPGGTTVHRAHNPVLRSHKYLP